MTDHKRKREPENFIELDSEETGFVLDPTQVEVGSGYTLYISYDESEKPIVDVKTYGEVNTAKLRKEIRRILPDAKIRGLDQKGSAAIVKRRKRSSAKKKWS